MTPEDIERANQRLAGTESFTVTPAKYLGHYVTAVLAARHGITVRLQGSVVVGIAALVELPALAAHGLGARRPAPAADPPLPRRRRPRCAAPVDMMGSGEAGRDAERRGRPQRGGAAAGRASARRPSRPVPSVPYAGGAALPARRPRDRRSTRPRVPWWSCRTQVTSAAPPAPVPERTASGLVRRVRGAHVPRRGGGAARAPSLAPRRRTQTRPATLDRPEGAGTSTAPRSSGS